MTLWSNVSGVSVVGTAVSNMFISKRKFGGGVAKVVFNFAQGDRSSTGTVVKLGKCNCTQLKRERIGGVWRYTQFNKKTQTTMAKQTTKAVPGCSGTSKTAPE